MRIEYGKQLNVEDISEEGFALFIFAINHEKRVLTSYEALKKTCKIDSVIGLRYKKDFTIDLHKEVRTVLIEYYHEINDLLDEFFNSSKKESLNIAIDYSCMTKSWYYTIILYMSMRHIDTKEINIHFIYTPSKYADPLSPKPNTEIAPLPGKYIVPTDKPKALIVCLGYEKNKAQGIIEHLDPKEKYILYSNPALDDEFVSKIKENNYEILSTYNDKIVTFPLNNLLQIERELTSIYFLLKDQYSIIIAPLGPKPFTLVSMLLSVKYRDIDIWRVGSGYNINEYDREPIDENTFIISKVKFV